MLKLHRLVRNGMFVFLLCLSGSVLAANDLKIEKVLVSVVRNGVSETGNIPYLATSDNLEASVNMQVSWEFDGNPPPSFDARLEVHSLDGLVSQRTTILAMNIAFDGKSEVQTRGTVVTAESKTITLSSLQNIADFSDLVAEARHKGYTVEWRLIIDITNVVAESSESNNTRSDLMGITFWPLLGDFNVGDSTSIRLTQVDAVTEDSMCETSSGNTGLRDNLSITGTAIWNPGTNWDNASLEGPDFCAVYSQPEPGKALVLEAVTTLNVVGDVTGTLNGINVTLGNVAVHSEPGQGITINNVIVPLPDGLSVHEEFDNKPEALGLSEITMTSFSLADVNDLNTLQASDSDRFLHSEGLPFSIRYSLLTLGSSGLAGDYNRVHYQHNRSYRGSDSRASGRQGLVSNDRRFSAPNVLISPGDESFVVTSNGLQITQVRFNSVGTVSTHYPKIFVNNVAQFIVEVEDGAFKAQQALRNVDTGFGYSFSMASDCAACPTNGQSVTYALARGYAEGLSADGAVAIKVNQLSNPEWGPAESEGSNVRIFERFFDTEKNGMMYFPGHIAVGTGSINSGKVVDSLMGHRELALVEGADSLTTFDDRYVPGVHHFLDSPPAKLGNYFTAGLTVGPEVYSDASGQPVPGMGENMGDTALNVRLGGHANAGDPAPAVLTLSGGLATKYVVRRAGLTGVFNPLTATPTASVYDYYFEFDRFAFRQVNNVIDDYTWIDGLVSIPGKDGVDGKAGVDVVFESLGIGCSGDLVAGVVAYDNCSTVGDDNGNGRPDENCTESLAAWNADIDILSLLFVAEDPSPAAMCDSQPRFVRLGNTVKLHALDRPLGMLASWTPEGMPFDASVSGVTDHVLDRPKGAVLAEENQGFNIALDSGIDIRTPEQSDTQTGLFTDGWFGLSGNVALPFWESPEVSVRIANSQVNDELRNDELQEQTIVTRKGGYLLASLDADNGQSNAQLADAMSGTQISVAQPNADINAGYQWGKTDFRFDLPLYYASGRATDAAEDKRKKPAFLGRQKKDVELVIMNVDHGVNFVTPEKTRISFGASANFDLISQLGNKIDLHVDFNDPDSVEKVDDFLCTFPIPDCDKGVDKRPVGSVFYALHGHLDKLNSVVGSSLDGFIEKGVATALNNATVNPFLGTISDTLGRMHALPDTLGSTISTGFNGLADQIILPLGDDIDSRMVNLYLGLPELVVKAQTGGTLTSQELIDLQAFEGDIQLVIDALDAAKAAALDIEGNIDGNEGVSSLLADITSSARTGVSDSLVALQNLIDVLDAPTGSDGDLVSCDFNLADPKLSTNKLIAKLGSVHERLGNIDTALGTFDILTFGGALADAANVDLGSLTTASREIDDRIEDLSTVFTEVQTAIASICSLQDSSGTLLNQAGSDLDNITQTAQDLLLDLRTQVLGIDIAASAIRVAVNDTVNNLRAEMAVVTSGLDNMIGALGTLKTTAENARTNGPTGGYVWSNYTNNAAGYAEARLDLQAIFSVGAPDAIDFFYPPFDSQLINRSFVFALSTTIRQAVNVAIADVAGVAHAELQGLIDVVPQPSAGELRQLLVNLIMNSAAIDVIDIEVNRQLSRLHRPVTDLVVGAADQVNFILQDLAKQLEAAVQQALGEAQASVLDNMPIKAGQIDGYALIAGNELERLHVGAEWESQGESDESGTTYTAALDVINLSVSSLGKTCNVDEGSGTLSAVISSKQLPIVIGSEEATIRALELGFSLETSPISKPVGLFGGIFLDGSVDFGEFTFYDLGFAAGSGKLQNYIGATGAGMFDDYQFNGAFLVGNTCGIGNINVLESLDPKTLVETQDGVFSGVYTRGGASARIYPYPPAKSSCSLRVIIGADMGAWVLNNSPLTYGGLIGGSATGEVACVASLRGQVLTHAQKVGDQFVYGGEGFGVGGVGWDCDPGDWTSVSRSRKDDYCLTGDAQFKAEYKDGWNIKSPNISAGH